MELITPSLRYMQSYTTALEEFAERGISGFWKFFGPLDDPEHYIHTILQYRHTTSVPEGMVPASVYWLIDNGEFIGHVSIRHRLNAALEQEGGHIGYAVRPSKQGQGYGSQLLALALPKAKALGIHDALLTCDKENAASRAIIEKNGGAFFDAVDVRGMTVLHFRIRL